ncbi:MAG: autotransporter outer membrane beta-barrel domain-containing protein [Candidatus Berkiella sp.]
MRTNHKLMFNLLMLVCGLFIASFAHAALYSCTDPIYGVNGTGGYGTTYTSSSCLNNHTANASSSIVTSNAVLQATAAQVSDLITSRLENLRNPQNQRVASAQNILGSGMSSGDSLGAISVWANGSWQKIKNDFTSTAFDGHVATAMVGADTVWKDYDMIIGLAFGWEDQGINTTFNSGKQDATGWSLTPYASWMIDNNWSVTMYGGYSWLDYDLSRRDPATMGEISGSADASRWYIGGDLNLNIVRDPTRFDLYMGVMHLSEKRDDYNESGAQTLTQPSFKNDISRFRLGSTLGYLVHPMVEPYVKAALLWDFNQTNIPVASAQLIPAHASTALVFGGGFNVFVLQNVFLNFEGFTEAFRDNYDRYGVNASILVNFG